MQIEGAGPSELTRMECLALLPSAEAGRIAVMMRALPLILPVSFVLEGDQIVISTLNGTTLDAATDNAVIAFQADGSSDPSAAHWSVHVTAFARRVTDLVELDRLSTLPSWRLGRPSRLVVISTDEMWGGWLPTPDGPFERQPPSVVDVGAV